MICMSTKIILFSSIICNIIKNYTFILISYECIFSFSHVGVEAQTLTVWRQAERYHIPRIIYVNKMDRKDANITMTCNSIEKKLQIQPLLLQLPAVENGKLVGELVFQFDL